MFIRPENNDTQYRGRQLQPARGGVATGGAAGEAATAVHQHLFCVAQY